VAKKTLLCLALALPLAFFPQATFAVPPRSTKSSKTTKDKSPQSKKTRSSRKRFKKYKRHALYSGSYYSESSNCESDNYQPNIAGVVETKPLMRVIPQRDGRFLLEPLSPKKKANPLIRSTSMFENNNNLGSAGRGYNLYEPWNFRELVISLAKCYRGVRYSRGASLNTTNATDCSGFVQYIYQGFKIDLPRSSREQAQVGKIVTRNLDFSKLLPGDLLFFGEGRHSIGHAGIYMGEGKMIHASNYRKGVIVTDLRQDYYQNTFVVAKRVFEVNFPK
jgi:cell wall-associated NlpC family hydrolase